MAALQVQLLSLAEEAEDRELWIQETLALLEPLTRQSTAIAKILADNISTFCQLLLKPDGPLSMSLGELQTLGPRVNVNTLKVSSILPTKSQPWIYRDNLLESHIS